MKVFKSGIYFILLAFLASLLLISCASAPQVKPFTVKSVKVLNGSPEKSFWRDQVIYPFSVKYAKAKDSHGIEWEVAYMDEYYGLEPNPKVLVLIHGKGGFGAYYGHVMKVALSSGLRVIVPDLPGFGKSIPGNLNNPLSRSLQDTREVMHEIIVKQLGVKKATYLGHSLGGQWVLGYALTYPEAVEKIILEDSAGLEEYPTSIKMGGKDVPLFTDAQKDMKVWEADPSWGARLKQGLAQGEEFWRNFVYFKQKDPKTGNIEPSKVGFFYNDTEYARAFTEIRVGMISANKQEYERAVTEETRDIYALGIEVRKEDPNSIAKRTKYIKVPIFLTFGEKDPLMPTPLSGKTDLRWEVIKPFYYDLKKAGNPPLVKIYPGAGHFVHTDLPDLYSNDVVSFVLKSKASGPLEDVDNYKAPDIKAPEDVQAFFDQFKKDILSKDMKKIEPHYATNFKQDGSNRNAFLGVLNNTVGFVTNYVIKLTKFEAFKNNPDIVLIDGSVDLGSITVPFAAGSMIIKENGAWKWYGNQK
jgi:pimeloyl-ACP methyl ester carboxylesterase